MTEIFPTHDCFNDVIEIIEKSVTSDPELAYGKDLLLVHGIIEPYGQRVSHAWVEYQGSVWFAGILEGERIYSKAELAEYYEESKVIETTKYTCRQIWDENKRSGHFGPWEEKYLALCRNKKAGAV